MKRIHLIIFSLILLTFACQDKVTLDVPEGEERLVVDGLFTNEASSVITLSKTAPYFKDGKTPRIIGANVIITSNVNDTIRLTEDPEFPGDYRANEPGEIGKTYTLQVTLPTGEKYTSIPERMNRVPVIDSIYYKNAKDLDQPFLPEGYIIYIDTQEPPGIGDFYRWIVYRNGEPQNLPGDLAYASDELVDGNYIDEADMVYEMELHDSVTIKQLSISERAYNFLILVDQQTAFVGGPFDAPPSPIKGNVKSNDPDKKDALGYFSVAAVTTASVFIQ